MIFAEFYHESTGWNGKDFSGPVKLIPACGDRSVIILDGRMNMENLIAFSRYECVRRGYKGFTINRGESFTRSAIVRALEVLK